MKKLLYGTGGEKVRFRYENDFGHERSLWFRLKESLTIWSAVTGTRLRMVSVSISKDYMSAKPCGSCKGQRLQKESLAVTIGNENIAYVTALVDWRSAAILSNRLS